MIARLFPAALRGEVTTPPSKSDAQRLLIAAWLAGDIDRVQLNGAQSADIAACVRCLHALSNPEPCLDCGDSGAVLRFLTPVAAALGGARMTGSHQLAARPMGALLHALAENGCRVSGGSLPFAVSGGLRGGVYALPGDVSSQFISGLLFALPLLSGSSELIVTGERESASYLDLTLRALADFGVVPRQSAGGWTVLPQPCRRPGLVRVEGDWSNAAPWLCLGALGGESVTVTGMDMDSLQGDKAICQVLTRMGARISVTGDRVTALWGRRTPADIDAKDIPDLVPVLAAVAAATPGTTRITGAARLRLKESDRLETTARALSALRGQVEQTEDGLIIQGRAALEGGRVDAAGDHRIAMAAAVASGACTGPVVVTGAQAVEKSYPTFWKSLRALGKEVEEDPFGP